MNLSAKEATISFRRTKAQPVVEVSVPAGTTLDASRKIEDLIYTKLGPEILNIAACPNCRSGLDVMIRERFEDVLRVDLESFKVLG